MHPCKPCCYTLLPFRDEGWTPASHRDYPPALQAAFRAVLLAAERRRAQLVGGACRWISRGKRGFSS